VFDQEGVPVKKLVVLGSMVLMSASVVIGASAVAASGASAASSGVLGGGGPMIRVPAHGFTASTKNALPTVSENWSGYAVTSKVPFTDVSGEWVVPTVTCNGIHKVYSSEWVGIDGFNDQTVEQDGTSYLCKPLGNYLTPSYYAWIEMFPAPTVRAFVVKPGDVISASVSYADDYFNTTVTDVTSGLSKTIKTKASGQLRDSAEWIMERPAGCNSTETKCFLFKLANFGMTTMSESVAQVTGQPAQGLSTFKNIAQIFMIQPNAKGFYTLEITGNVYPADNSFPVTWTRYGKIVPIQL
jgi:hypothetical protein